MTKRKNTNEVDKLCLILKKHGVKQFISPDYTIIFNEHQIQKIDIKKSSVQPQNQMPHFNHMPSAIDFLGEIK